MSKVPWEDRVDARERINRYAQQRLRVAAMVSLDPREYDSVHDAAVAALEYADALLRVNSVWAGEEYERWLTATERKAA